MKKLQFCKIEKKNVCHESSSLKKSYIPSTTKHKMSLLYPKTTTFDSNVQVNGVLTGFTISRLDKFIDDHRKAFLAWEEYTYTPNEAQQNAHIEKIEQHFVIDDAEKTITIPATHKFVIQGDFQQATSSILPMPDLASLGYSVEVSGWRWATEEENPAATALINKWNDELSWPSEAHKIQFGGEVKAEQLALLQTFLNFYGTLPQLYYGHDDVDAEGAAAPTNKIYPASALDA